MCVVSFVGNNFEQRWYPWKQHMPSPLKPKTATFFPPTGPTQADFDNLKKEVEILKSLLKEAKEYDEKNNEPDCEIEEKMQFLKAVAKLVDIDLDDVIGKSKADKV